MDLSSYFTALQQPGPNPQHVTSPFPAGYMSPDAIKAMYDYSQALLKNSEQPVPGTKGGWTVGVQHLVDALMGGQQAYAANQARLGSQGYDASQYPTAPGGMADNTAKSEGASSDKSAPKGDALAYASSGGSDLLSKAAKVTGSQESGNDYSNVTTTKNPRTGQTQSAIGKYGVMDFNVGPWTQEVLGKAMTPEEFRHNPQAQDAVYKTKMGQYIAQYGIEGAGRAWLGGPGGVNHPERTDALGTSVGSYGKDFASKLAFNGQPQGTPAQDSIVLALQKGKAAAPSVAGVPSGQAQEPYVSPFAVPQRPQVNRAQYEHILASPWISDAQKQQVQQWYMEQHQPIGLPYLGGSVIVNPNNPREQFYSPGVKWNTMKAGNAEVSVPQIIQPGVRGQPPTTQTIEEPGGGTPTAPAIGAPPPPLPAPAPISPGVPTPGPTGAAPTAPASPTVGQAVPPAAAANQVASNVPMATAGAVQPPSPAETGEQAITKAEGALPPVGAPSPTAAPNAPMGDKVAAALATNPPPVKDGTQVAYLPKQLRELQEFDLGQKRREADIGDFHKNLQTYTDIGIRAQKELQTLPIAIKMAQDPRYYSGFGADLYEGAKKLQSLVGDKAAAAPMEIFNKILSGNIVQDLKVQLGGLGQIRLAEINLITNSVANKYNTPAANLAVLQIMQRQAQQSANIGRIADAYAKGYVPGPNGQWQRSNEPPTNYGLQQVVDQYTTQHPLFSDAELAGLEHVLNISPHTENKAVGSADAVRAQLVDAAGPHLVGGSVPTVSPQGTTQPSPQAAPAAKSDPLGIR